MANRSKFGWLKRVLVLGLVVGGLAGGILYFTSDRSEAPQYQSAPVTRGDLTQAVTASGTLNPVINVQVGSQISGNIAKLYADFNSPVKSNQVVAQLDPAIYKAIVHQAEADLANANAALELQQVETRRSEALFKDRLIPQSDYDKAVANLHQAEAQVKMKEASLERARVDLAHCTIFSPVDGIVVSRSVDVGQTVAASMNAPVLFMIANDLTKMQIDANVSEADVGTVEDGQTVTFTVDAFLGRTFTGKVTQIRNAPITVQNVVTYDTVIEVANPDLKLKPGMTATASIVTAQRNDVLKIPNSALRFRPPEPATNQSFAARILAKIGLGNRETNAAPPSVSIRTNTTETAATLSPPLTGNEPPEELMRRVREMRQRGEEPSPEVRAKLRELFQSGAFQRAGQGGPRPGGGGPDLRPRPGPAWRTVYLLVTNAPTGSGAPQPSLKTVRIKTGISDGAYTEVTEGLDEDARVVTSVKLSASQTPSPAPAGTSPFGGMRRF